VAGFVSLGRNKDSNQKMEVMKTREEDGRVEPLKYIVGMEGGKL
jgi:hypothetical protein